MHTDIYSNGMTTKQFNFSLILNCCPAKWKKITFKRSINMFCIPVPLKNCKMEKISLCNVYLKFIFQAFLYMSLRASSVKLILGKFKLT